MCFISWIENARAREFRNLWKRALRSETIQLAMDQSHTSVRSVFFVVREEDMLIFNPTIRSDFSRGIYRRRSDGSRANLGKLAVTIDIHRLVVVSIRRSLATRLLMKRRKYVARIRPFRN